MRSSLLLLAALVTPASVTAQTRSSPSNPGNFTSTTYAQDFNGIAYMGSSQALPAGFQIVENGTGAAVDGAYQVGTGSNEAGGAYSFGANGTKERALGALTSGGVSPIVIGAVFTNGLGAPITAAAFDFFGEQWRSGAANTLRFEYSTNATSLLDGSWTALSALDVASLIVSGSAAALNGNAAANRTEIKGVVGGLSIANGGTFGFRWTQADVPGADPGLAIDDLTIQLSTPVLAAAPMPEPATWAMMLAGLLALGTSLRHHTRRRRAMLTR